MKREILTSGRWSILKVKGRFLPSGLILMYHRVAEMDADPSYLRVTPGHFAEHMDVLRKRTQPLSLIQMAQAVSGGRIPPRAVAVTFDDGYLNNLLLAKPLLELYNIPATVFVTTGYLGSAREYWWDELDRLLLQPGTLPENLLLSCNGERREWQLGAATTYSRDEYQHDCAHDRDQSNRIKFYYSVWEWLQPLHDSYRVQLLDQVRIWAGRDSGLRQSHRSLASDEVRALADGGLVEIGAHTVNHAMLSAHPLDVQRCEIEQSRAYLQDLLGKEIRTFSYPFGQYTDEAVHLVRNAGFTAACSVEKRVVDKRCDRFKLPRFSVLDWDGDEFERQLFNWLNG